MSSKKRRRMSDLITEEQPAYTPLMRALCNDRRKYSTWTIGTKSANSTTLTICEGYDKEGYTSMNTDTVRNKLYTTAIKSIPSSDQFFWIDLGCGSSALLTVMVLKQHGQCVAIDCNPSSAANALMVLKDFALTRSDEFCVLSGSSEDEKVARKLQSMVTKEQTLCVVHEIFGFFASSEGAPLALSQLRRSLPENKIWKFLPGRAGTFFQPSNFTSDCTKKISNIYVSSKLVLCRRLDFEKVCLTEPSSFRHFEWYDFNDDTQCNLKMQEKISSFDVVREGNFNSMSCFLFIDFGTVVPRPTRCNWYPFDDPALENKPHDLSMCSCSSAGSYATNWQNPVILFPFSLAVKIGDKIVVTSKVKVDTIQPHYHFSAVVQRQDQEIGGGDVHLEHGDLYPDWVQLKPK